MKSMNFTSKDLLLLLTMIAGFFFTVSFSSYYVTTLIHEGKVCSCLVPVPLMIMIMSSLGFFVGGVVSYYFSKKIGSDKEKKKIHAEKSLDFLEGDEKIIVKQLITNNGALNQSKIKNLSRVRITRALKKLEKKNVIKKEKKGMTNKLLLDEQLTSLFEIS